MQTQIMDVLERVSCYKSFGRSRVGTHQDEYSGPFTKKKNRNPYKNI